MRRMALDLTQLEPQLEHMAQAVSHRAQEQAVRVPEAQALLRSLAANRPALTAKLAAVRGLAWAGAVPLDDALAAAYPAPALPQPCTILAADGSQILPDRHRPAMYYLINIGCIILRLGTGAAPEQISRPQLFFSDEDLYENDSLISSARITARRDVQEVGELARLAPAEASRARAVALVDNGLLLYLSLQEYERAIKKDFIAQHISHLRALEQAGVPVAGVIDRPRAANVLRLLHLATLDATAISQDAVRSLGAFQRLTDAELFSFLQPGERSAVFALTAPDNRSYYEPEGQGVCVFYLNAAGNILRVETPQWVAAHPPFLEIVHAALIEQCHITGGFPYVLTRAHELAVVSAAEHADVEARVGLKLARRGVLVRASHKQQGKWMLRRTP